MFARNTRHVDQGKPASIGKKRHLLGAYVAVSKIFDLLSQAAALNPDESDDGEPISIHFLLIHLQLEAFT